VKRREHNRGHTVWPFLTLLVVLSALHGPAGAEGQTRPASHGSYLPGQIIVKLRRPVTLQHLQLRTSGGRSRVVGHIPQLRITLLQVPPGSERTAIAQLLSDPAVEYAELNYRARALDTPDDPSWPQQWALPKILCPEAWDITHCQGTVVAAVDTGVDVEHPDLSNVLWVNLGEVPDNGIDDDGNGKVDDIHGWHFFHQEDGSGYEPRDDAVIEDDNGHGTHVSGIMAAETNNGIGITGVSWGARVMTVKVLDAQGEGLYSDVARGIIYAVDNGAQIINLSLGGEEPSQTLQNAVDYASQHGALMVAASGNDGGSVLYPAALEEVMAIAATNSDDEWRDWSNHGPEIDIAAPGISIFSTEPWGDGYSYRGGTSMAAAHVSGAAALLWSWRPDYSSTLIQRTLESQADDVNAATYPGHDPYLGWGRLNIYRALSAPEPSPTPTPTRTPTPWYICILMPIYKSAGPLP